MPVERGGRPRRLNADAILRHLQTLVEDRGLGEQVRIRDACAGGCGQRGPNVTVTIYPSVQPGERPDHVAVAWKTYVASLKSLECLARVIDDNLQS